jgi:dolichol-phosphate mannosyltransferase
MKSTTSAADPDSATPLLKPSAAVKWRFLRFAAVGGSGVVVNFAVVWLAEMALRASLDPVEFPLLGTVDAVSLFALIAGILVSIFTNFLINDAWTWGDRSKTSAWLARCRDFYVTNGLAAGLQLAVAWTLVNFAVFHIVVFGLDLTSWSVRLASLSAIAIATPLNYVVNNVWTFRDR